MPKGIYIRKSGYKLTKEHIEKLRIAKLKNPVRYWLAKKRDSMVGDKNNQWKGDKASYSALHIWVRKYLGKPNTCEHCNKKELNNYKIHWANKSHKYKRDLSDWLRLCVPCHYKYDKT